MPNFEADDQYGGYAPTISPTSVPSPDWSGSNSLVRSSVPAASYSPAGGAAAASGGFLGSGGGNSLTTRSIAAPTSSGSGGGGISGLVTIGDNTPAARAAAAVTSSIPANVVASARIPSVSSFSVGAGANGNPAVRDTVRNFQQGLADAGQDPGPIDGIFGQRTKKAYQAWRRANGITTGSSSHVDDDVIAALTGGATITTMPTARPTRSIDNKPKPGGVVPIDIPPNDPNATADLSLSDPEGTRRKLIPLDSDVVDQFYREHPELHPPTETAAETIARIERENPVPASVPQRIVAGQPMASDFDLRHPSTRIAHGGDILVAAAERAKSGAPASEPIEPAIPPSARTGLELARAREAFAGTKAGNVERAAFPDLGTGNFVGGPGAVPNALVARETERSGLPGDMYAGVSPVTAAIMRSNLAADREAAATAGQPAVVTPHTRGPVAPPAAPAAAEVPAATEPVKLPPPAEEPAPVEPAPAPVAPVGALPVMQPAEAADFAAWQASLGPDGRQAIQRLGGTPGAAYSLYLKDKGWTPAPQAAPKATTTGAASPFKGDFKIPEEANPHWAPGKLPTSGVRGVVHVTGVEGQSVKNVMNGFLNNPHGLRAQFVVADGKWYQIAPDGAKGQHVLRGNHGINNTNSLGIEIVGKNDKSYSEDDVAALQDLAKHLTTDPAMKAWGMNGEDPAKVFYGHGEVNTGRGHHDLDEGQRAIKALRGNDTWGSAEGAAKVAYAPGNEQPVMPTRSQGMGIGGESGIPVPEYEDYGNLDQLSQRARTPIGHTYFDGQNWRRRVA